MNQLLTRALHRFPMPKSEGFFAKEHWCAKQFVSYWNVVSAFLHPCALRCFQRMCSSACTVWFAGSASEPWIWKVDAQTFLKPQHHNVKKFPLMGRPISLSQSRKHVSSWAQVAHHYEFQRDLLHLCPECSWTKRLRASCWTVHAPSAHTGCDRGPVRPGK